MILAAIVAEYNPFHNGHVYHIKQTRSAGATHIVAIMSGNFTQRGSAAIFPKHVRARAALMCGVDLVVELPLPYAMATAQRFALGAVSVANAMGCVDLLSFGSESGYLSIIQAAAGAVDDPGVRERLAAHLSQGVTFAKARQLAVSEQYGDEVGDMLGMPNDALAVEYVRQIMLTQSAIEPFSVQRAGPGHDSAQVSGELASASFIRGLLRSGGPDAARDLIPESVYLTLCEACKTGDGLFDDKKLEAMMIGVLRRLDEDDFGAIPDMSEGLENRLLSAVRQASTMKEVYDLSKSKRYTAARIRRGVMSACVGVDRVLSQTGSPYIRVLGFNDRGKEILSAMKESARLPVMTSLAQLEKLDCRCREFARLEARSTDLYRLGLPKIGPCGTDYTTPCVVV